MRMKRCAVCGLDNEPKDEWCENCRSYIGAPEVSGLWDTPLPDNSTAHAAPTVRAELRMADNKDYKFAVTSGDTVGRGADIDVTIVPGSNTISRRHARFYVEAGEWWIEPINLMGTFVGGRRVRQPQRLCGGDTIALGSIGFVFTVKS
jgi:FHA domain